MANAPETFPDADIGLDFAVDSPELYNLKNSFMRKRITAGSALTLQDTTAGPKLDAVQLLNDNGYMWTKNTSGSNRKPGEILGISNAGVPTPQSSDTDARTINFFQNRNANGVTPTLAGYWGNFVVCVQAIPNSTWGWCRLTGDCLAYVNVINTVDNFCDVTDSDCTQLTSGPIGAASIIKNIAGTTGKVLCWINKSRANFGPAMVKVTQNGGVSGTDGSVTCTFTYDIKPLGGSTKYNSSVITPKTARIANLKYTAATIGMVYIDTNASNAFGLTLIDEVPDSGTCS